jgi:serine/threonine protein kinase
MASLVGRTLGNIEVLEHINHGGMATVYKGRQLRLGRDVAVKVMHPHLVSDPDLLARFKREALAVTRLRHRNIVQVFDFDAVEEEDLYYMVVEYIDGGSLKDSLDQLSAEGKHLPVGRTAAIFAGVADALDYAHRMEILHRDVKPGNILLDRDGQACLTDFGVAHVIGARHLTLTGTLVGTPAYMSPEQCQGIQVTPASDIYSFGILLYEMLSGKLPFDASSPLETIHDHVNTPPPPMRLGALHLPDAIEYVVQKALAKQPDDRFENIPALRAAALAALGKPSAGIAVQTHVHSVTEVPPPPEIAVSPSKATTEVWQPGEEDQPESLTSRETEVWHPDESSGHSDTTRVAAAASLPVQNQPLSGIEQPSGHPTPVTDPPQKQPRKRRRLWIILGAVLLVMIGLTAAALVLDMNISFNYPPEAAGCENPDSCREQANQFMQDGDFPAAIESINQAIFFAETEAHPPHAELWCLRGEAHAAFEDFNEAIISYENCIAWTEDDPGLEDLRVFAAEQIAMLSGQ